MPRQHRIAGLIMKGLWPLAMVAAIDFHHDTAFETDKVEVVAAERTLPAKVVILLA